MALVDLMLIPDSPPKHQTLTNGMVSGEKFYFTDDCLLSKICVVGFFFLPRGLFGDMMIQLDLRGHIGKLPSEEESPASLLGPICWNSYLPENMAGWKTHHE